MQLVDGNGALDTLATILMGSRIANANVLTNARSQALEAFVQKYAHGIESYLALVDFINQFGIYLHFIGFINGQFRLINDYQLVRSDGKQTAFIVLNGDRTVCGPLFLYDSAYQQRFVFALDDQSVHTNVLKYIDRLNRTGI